MPNLSRSLLAAICAFLLPAYVFAAPAFVQQRSTVPQSPQASVSATYTAAQTLGNFNVVVVGWSDTTAHVASVTDSKGNVYALAVGPTQQAGIATQSIYYATNIASAAAGTNTVNVQFDVPAIYVDLRIAEYSGIATAGALDVTAAAMGNSAMSDSGAVTTTNANDLIIGANLQQGVTSGVGAGFTSRVITDPDTDILEDHIVTTAGSYSATAPLASPSAWIMQLAAFRAAGSGGGDTQAPSAPGSLATTVISSTQINLGWTASTDNVGVTNYLIERCAGASCSNFAQIATATGTTFNDTGLTASTSYSYRVRATDAANNLSTYSNTASGTTSAAPDTQAPTAPSSLAASVISTSQINLTWTASTDNVGVTNYLIERCAGASCSNFAQIATATGTTFNNTGLTASTSYSYRVRATDAASNLSAYSNTATASTSAAPDTQAPTAPSSLATAVISSTQINLSWTASTDNVGVTSYLIERCTGAGCSNFAQIGTSAAVGYSDTTLVASTLYRYRVRATDAANNLSGYSNVSNGTTTAAPDTQAPTAPSNLTATVLSSTQINLSWTASTDNVGVTGYLVERCAGAACSSFTQIGTATGTAYGDTGLTASTVYSYRVRAKDAANNMSAYSGTASATTQAGAAAPLAYVQSASATPQTPQTTVAVKYAVAQTARNLNVIAIGWFNATSHVLSVTDTTGNTYAVAAPAATDAQAGTHVMYYAANIGGAAANANTVTVTFDSAVPYADVRIAEYSGVDTANPIDVAVSGSGSSVTSNSGAVTTSSANDLLVAGSYVTSGTSAAGAGFTKRIITDPDGDILEDSIVTTAGSYSATATLSPSGSWIMQMVAFRAATTGGGDTQAPSAPSNLAATTVSSSQIDLSWIAATDNVGVTNYLIERCAGAACSNFAQIATTAGTTYSNTGLTGSTSYSYRVRATDAANNLGAYSGVATATTSTVVDTQAPSVPTNLVATAVLTTQVNLTWTASTDDVGVTGYLIESCAGSGCSSFTQIATTAGTAYSDTGLTASTSYTYRVRATDAASNVSGYSGLASATTPAPDTQAPSAPTNLGATAISNSQINIGWTASTDNVGVTGYRVERCAGAACSNFAQVGAIGGTALADSGLASGTSYSYRVLALDAAGNLSPYSAVASATTQTAPTLPPIAFVQTANSIPQSPVTSVNAAFAGAQTVGNLNVVAIAWSNATSQITSVTDTAGNVYALAAGPTVDSTTGSLAIYYAANVKAAAAGNRITVAFNSAVPYPDLRIAEYTGIDPNNPVDAGAEASGSGIMSSSGSFVTTYPYDLIVGANYVSSGTTAAGGGFTSRVITFPDGDILEDRIVTTTGSYGATAPMSSGSWIMQGVAFRGGVPPAPDTVPPTVSVSAPAANATLSGTVTLTAAAADTGGSGMGGVQFQIDGINVGPADAAAPFSMTFNTALLANGSHVITSYAWDGSRNITYSVSVPVTFSNASAGAPANTGLWQGPFAWPLVSIHLNLLADGRILAWDQLSTGTPDPRVWDPLTSSFTTVQTNDGQNLFCSGHISLPDGRLFVPGGEVWAGAGVANSHIGLTSTHFFDPSTNQWSSGPDMAYGRWYPTATTMSDGRIFTIGGETNCFGCNAVIPEIYNPATNSWSQITTASRTVPWYPYTFVMPDGKVLMAGGAQAPSNTATYDPSTKTWTTVDSRVLDAGSAAMYLPGKIIKSGTSTDTESGTGPSSATTYMLDMTQANPQWQQIGSMAFPRTFHVMTTLPDGNVLVTGGGRTSGFADLPNAVHQAELWSPTTQTWSTLGSMASPRLYHQTATLLPDGRVLVTGSGRGFGRADATDQLSAEVFAPPYLFKGARPVISSTPTQLSINQVFTVQTPDAARIAKVVLIRNGSVTHTFNMDQRYVPLSFTAGSGSLTVTAPATSNLVPPGNYMLFLVDTSGVPSVAQIVRF